MEYCLRLKTYFVVFPLNSCFSFIWLNVENVKKKSSANVKLVLTFAGSFIFTYPRRFTNLGCGCFFSFGSGSINGGFIIKVITKEITHKTDITVKVA